LSARWSRKSVSRSSSPARERDSPRNEEHHSHVNMSSHQLCERAGASATIHSFFLKEEGSGAGRQVLVRALNYRSFLLK
jgi:hypothetical protein